MSIKISVLPIPLTDFDSATMSGSYQAISTSGLFQPCIILRIINDSDKAITISYDGITDHDYLPANGTLQLDLQTNARKGAPDAMLSANTVVYVKGEAGTGTIYLAGYYQPQV